MILKFIFELVIKYKCDIFQYLVFFSCIPFETKITNLCLDSKNMTPPPWYWNQISLKIISWSTREKISYYYFYESQQIIKEKMEEINIFNIFVFYQLVSNLFIFIFKIIKFYKVHWNSDSIIYWFYNIFLWVKLWFWSNSCGFALQRGGNMAKPLLILDQSFIRTIWG